MRGLPKEPLEQMKQGHDEIVREGGDAEGNSNHDQPDDENDEDDKHINDILLRFERKYTPTCILKETQ